MSIRVRGCEATLTVEDDASGGKAMVLRILGSNVKDDVEALKKLREWGFVKSDKPNLGSHAAT